MTNMLVRLTTGGSNAWCDRERIVIDPVYSKIGAAFRKRRDEIGMTQSMLADHLQLSRTSVTNIERGRQPLSIHQFILACQLLKLSAGDLLQDAASLKPQAPASAPEEFLQLFALLKPAKKGRT